MQAQDFFDHVVVFSQHEWIGHADQVRDSGSRDRDGDGNRDRRKDGDGDEDRVRDRVRDRTETDADADADARAHAQTRARTHRHTACQRQTDRGSVCVSAAACRDLRSIEKRKC